MMKRKQLNEPAEVDAIEALRRAIVQASEQNWAWNDVPIHERERFRPDVAKLATQVTDKLRAEHASRIGGTP